MLTISGRTSQISCHRCHDYVNDTSDAFQHLDFRAASDSHYGFRRQFRTASIPPQFVSRHCCRHTTLVRCSCERPSPLSAGLPRQTTAQTRSISCINAAAADQLEQQKPHFGPPVESDADHAPESSLLGQVLVCIAKTLPAEVCRDMTCNRWCQIGVPRFSCT